MPICASLLRKYYRAIKNMITKSPGTDSTDKPHGGMAALFAIFAFIACNGLVILIVVFSVVGITVSINPHIQAAAISLFSVATLALVFKEFNKNRIIGPLILATAATVILIGTMYIHFNKIVESFGLLALFASALWSWRSPRHRCRHRV
jgi:hypothetical protein